MIMIMVKKKDRKQNETDLFRKKLITANEIDYCSRSKFS